MSEISSQKVVPIDKSSSPLQPDDIQKNLNQLPNWKLVEVDGEKRIERTFTFPDFASALRFTDQVGNAADEVNHHPALLTEWGKVKVSWWTHKVHGLHMNDFIMASRTNDLYQKQ